MPWSNNHLPKYRKHRSSGQAVVTLNGRDFYLGPHGTKASKLQYDRLLAEWLQNSRNPFCGLDDGITVVELCARYFKFAKEYYQRDGKCTGETPNIRIALRFLREWYAKTPAAEFGPLALKTLRQRMIEENLSRGYVNAQINRIKRMFKWAAAEELIPASAFQGLSSLAGLRLGKSGARETTPIMPVDDSVVDQTLPWMSTVVADMVRLQRLTGMRPAEVCLLRPCDLDRSGEVWVYKPATHKTEHHGRPRNVFVGPQSQAVLLRYLARGSDEYCFRPCDSEAKRLSAQRSSRYTAELRESPRDESQTQGQKSTWRAIYDGSYRRAIHYACDKAFPHPELGRFSG